MRRAAAYPSTVKMPSFSLLLLADASANVALAASLSSELFSAASRSSSLLIPLLLFCRLRTACQLSALLSGRLLPIQTSNLRALLPSRHQRTRGCEGGEGIRRITCCCGGC